VGVEVYMQTSCPFYEEYTCTGMMYITFSLYDDVKQSLWWTEVIIQPISL